TVWLSFPPLLPSTPLFRSRDAAPAGGRADRLERRGSADGGGACARDRRAPRACPQHVPAALACGLQRCASRGRPRRADAAQLPRSEEHTSELQSVKKSYAV